MPKKVLVVDDDPNTVRFLSVALEENGYEAVGAADGKEGFDKVVSEKPDLILLDVMMPGTDGPETLSLLRARAETTEIPIVFLTAKVQQREVDRYLALGALGVIRKPFDPLALPDEIRRITGAEASGP